VAGGSAPRLRVVTPAYYYNFVFLAGSFLAVMRFITKVCLKIREKIIKYASAMRDPPPIPVCLRQLGAPPPDLRVVIPAYYYNFVELVSSGKCISLPSKRTKWLQYMFCFYCFRIFAPIFYFKLCSFC